ncbi:hypothetical protein C8R44DRAFT_987693 [Mycena epipterygia]|nr:hypothetical protein C8R44DRAFT_987693 [Mycena epipterygia]
MTANRGIATAQPAAIPPSYIVVALPTPSRKSRKTIPAIAQAEHPAALHTPSTPAIIRTAIRPTSLPRPVHHVRSPPSSHGKRWPSSLKRLLCTLHAGQPFHFRGTRALVLDPAVGHAARAAWAMIRETVLAFNYVVTIASTRSRCTPPRVRRRRRRRRPLSGWAHRPTHASGMRRFLRLARAANICSRLG